MRNETSQPHDGSDPPRPKIQLEGIPPISNGDGLYFYILRNQVHIPAELYAGLPEVSWAAYRMAYMFPQMQVAIHGSIPEVEAGAFAN